jgi:hypothetical protein
LAGALETEACTAGAGCAGCAAWVTGLGAGVPYGSAAATPAGGTSTVGPVVVGVPATGIDATGAAGVTGSVVRACFTSAQPAARQQARASTMLSAGDFAARFIVDRSRSASLAEGHQARRSAATRASLLAAWCISDRTLFNYCIDLPLTSRCGNAPICGTLATANRRNAQGATERAAESRQWRLPARAFSYSGRLRMFSSSRMSTEQ